MWPIKQVLANSLYFHASFMLPSQELLAEIVECIDRFVAKGHWEEAPQGPLSHTPSSAAEYLPCPGTWVDYSGQISLHRCIPYRRRWQLCSCIPAATPGRTPSQTMMWPMGQTGTSASTARYDRHMHLVLHSHVR
jgi:hypothetical protein